MVDAYRCSKRRAVSLVGVSRSYFYYRPHPRDDRAERARIREIAETRVRYGMWRIHILMRREGWVINHKKTHRIYCEVGLNLRRKRPRRRVAAAHRMERPEISSTNESWSMDFVATMEHIQSIRGTPKRIQMDNGSEFISKTLDLWAYENGVTLDFSRLGEPTDNPFIESFNGSFRDECLNLNWFLSLDDAREKIETWRVDYNEYRPHQSLSDRTPKEFAAEHQQAGIF